ncbi:hypothetical protein [Bordetella trematum]|uniref:hypothetical protein n=1 Tax=Bordetella trematum TaxID=123899 RepID=UPI00046FB6EE|nr:hypothetical protein [Bordetella trematum]
MTEKHPDSDLIDRLGGTAVVARLCNVKPPSVSGWRDSGIPDARLMYLRVIRPEAFEGPAAAVTAQPAAAQQEVGHG